MSVKCTKCNLVIENDKEVAKCCDCNSQFHPGCCRVRTVEALKKQGSRRATWRCDSCKSDLDSTHSRSDSEQADSASIMGLLQTMRKEMRDNMQESRERFGGLELSIQEVKSVIEEFKERFRHLERDNESVKKNIEENSAELDKTKKELDDVKCELLDLQQYTRRNNLEIKGIPLTAGEDIYAVMEAVAVALEVPLRRGDLSVAHRLQTPRLGHPVIIAAFVSRSTKNAWLAAAKKKRLTTTDVSPGLKQGPVYINSHLTAYNKQLLGRAKRMVKEGKLAAAWTVDDKVFARKEEGGRAIRVRLMDDVEQLVK